MELDIVIFFNGICKKFFLAWRHEVLQDFSGRDPIFQKLQNPSKSDLKVGTIDFLAFPDLLISHILLKILGFLNLQPLLVLAAHLRLVSFLEPFHRFEANEPIRGQVALPILFLAELEVPKKLFSQLRHTVAAFQFLLALRILNFQLILSDGIQFFKLAAAKNILFGISCEVLHDIPLLLAKRVDNLDLGIVFGGFARVKFLVEELVLHQLLF